SFLLSTTRFPKLHDCCWSFYSSSVERLFDSSLKYPWPLDYVESCLAPFAVHASTQLDRTPPDILAAVIILAQAVELAQDKPNFWSEKLNHSLRALLMCRKKINDKSIEFEVRLEDIMRGLSSFTHDDVLVKLRTHSARGSFIKNTIVNILSRGRFKDEIPTFALLDIDRSYVARELAMSLMVDLAILSHHSLAGLLAPDDDLAELLDTLAGGNRGIQLALTDTKYFVTMASHGRVVSRQWWDDIKERLLNLTKERRRTWADSNHYYTPQQLVNAIEAQPPCEKCAATINKVRRALNARTVIDITPAMSQSGDAGLRRIYEWSTGTMADASPPDATAAVSPNGWRRRTWYMLESLRIPMHHPPGDAEMQPGDALRLWINDWETSALA
ncbi:hypothetical protein BKA62DRAFT_818013, partial [Auriculariales sp. MPI-PUGE-AT-0066]